MGHTYSNILLHVTFGTKGRVRLIGLLLKRHNIPLDPKEVWA